MTDKVSYTSIGPEFVAAVRADLTSVEIDGEIVVYDDVHQRLHRLNQTAATLWTCLDGSGTLGQIADDIAAVYGAEPDKVCGDVVTMARKLGREGLLVGVAGQEQLVPEGQDAVDRPFVAEPPSY